MRWRIAIGVLAVLGSAGAVYVGTQPRKGTVEWHKREYLKATNGAGPGQRTILSRAQSWYRRVRYGSGIGVCGGFLTQEEIAELKSKANALESAAAHHSSALVELGYLAECSVPITGAHTHAVVNALNSWREPFIKARLQETGTNQLIVVTAPMDVVGRCEEFIRKADVPVYEDTVAKIRVEND